MADGNRLRLTIVATHPTQYQAPWFRYLATHRPELPNTQTLLERRDGRFITAVIGARAARDASGVIRSYEGIVLDLSDRQVLEAQLYHAQKQESLGRLVSGVVHDFSNLLTAIGGSAELALREAASQTQRDDLEEVLKASQRATVLTRQLMSFSRREKLEPQVLDLNGVITDAGLLLRRLLGPEVEISFTPTTCGRSRDMSDRLSRSSSTWRSTRATRCRRAAI